MVQNTSSTFKDLITERVAKYNEIAPAAALLYNHNGNIGLRVEAPTLVLQFKDKLPFGRDPEGFLFYQNVGDIDIRHDSTYNIFSNFGASVPAGQEAVVIQFLNRNSTIYAEFVGQDPTRAAKQAVTNHDGGKWVTLDQANTNVTIDKETNSAITEIEGNAIAKGVKFNIPSTQSGYTNKPIHTTGTLYFKSISDLASGQQSRIDYNNDRILFYPNTYDNDPQLKDLVALFIPSPDGTGLQGFDFQSAVDDTAKWYDLRN